MTAGAGALLAFEAPDAEWSTVVAKAARWAARRYSLGHDARELERDIQQHCLLRWCEKTVYVTNYLREIRDTERHGLDASVYRHQLTSAIYEWARDYGQAEAAHNARRDPASMRWYTREQVIDMIPHVEEPEQWSSLASAPEREVRRSATGPADRAGDTMAAYGDLRRAWGALSGAQRRLLAARYRDGIPLPQIAAEAGEAYSTMQKRTVRALDRLMRLMCVRDA